MKYNFKIDLITKEEAIEMIQTYHYSNTLPRINKYFLGCFLNSKLVGCITLGYGTRPKHTIQCLFDNLDTSDYLEIGRMCMTDSMPRNSESQMLKAAIKWIKQNIPIKVLFTWADGMLGKCGYVYQASNFIYAGTSDSDIYLFEGYKIHPRQTRDLFKKDDNDTRLSIRPTIQQMKEYHVQRYKGHQFKYLYLLGNHKQKKELLSHATFTSLPYPKTKDLTWKTYNLDLKKWVSSSMPPYKTDFNQSINKKILIELMKKKRNETE